MGSELIGYAGFEVEISQNETTHFSLEREPGHGLPFVLRTVMLRNVGNGSARIEQIQLDTPSGIHRPTCSTPNECGASRPVVRSGEAVCIWSAEPRLPEDVQMVAEEDGFALGVEYTDLLGRQRTVTTVNSSWFDGKGPEALAVTVVRGPRAATIRRKLEPHLAPYLQLGRDIERWWRASEVSDRIKVRLRLRDW